MPGITWLGALYKWGRGSTSSFLLERANKQASRKRLEKVRKIRVA